MRKKSGEEKRPIEVDPITGEYSIKIPEWMVNELSWYEDTEITFNLEGSELILSEELKNTISTPKTGVFFNQLPKKNSKQLWIP